MNSTRSMPTTPLQNTLPHARSTQDTTESRQRSGFTSTMLYSWHYFTELLRRPETLVFCLILPAALYLMFGTATENSDSALREGNVAAFIMTGMGLYGSAIAMTSIFGSATQARQEGWNRQLHLAGLTTTQSVAGTIIAMVAFAALPILVTFATALATGSQFDHVWQWIATGVLSWLVTLPFAVYGLAAALWLRTETATGISSGSLVILAFFGGVFMPLQGTLFDISRFTPFYGPITIAHWPQMAGDQFGSNGNLIMSESPVFAFSVTLMWTAIFALLCVAGARRAIKK
ncbi:hypothetical protein I6J22_08515 [Corynebacterium kroppenstedtii]|uniref:ABC-type transport system, permease protein n=1 Tax=Corynebacterium kroppenstedtii (strain DSM 44385 / JCM 11950 / CIP 105744 / CCUG 35717) TaxID=645127 RepID=C4LKS2_CORK4|nr:ABC transporter permease [Corynebacterium kroppenstedtii]ACR18427.1 ABC-type transport system, permease protein [Corynebacterium kroppenstedtii DSM 44385]QRP10239.1 hypothetical protein I6J22_08515 [Corynebacterium kroppenstedtii]